MGETIAKLKQAEETIEFKLELEKMISSISSRFVGIYDIDDAITATLEDIGILSGASRAYLFLFNEDGTTMDNTHEWCAEGVSPQIDNLKNCLMDMAPWWMKKLRNNETIHITDVSKLPVEAQAEREILESQDIKSLLVLPLYIGGELNGFIGFDNVVETGNWSDNNITLLRLSSEILGNALERKKAEDELKQYQFMVESAHDAIFFKDLKSRYIIANNKTLEAFGLPKEKVIGKNDCEIMLNKEEAKKNIEDDQLVFETGKPREITKHMTGADGKKYWFQAIKVPRFDDGGNIIGLVGIARDITERKNAEEELNRLSNAVKMTTDSIVISDLDANIIDVNEATLKMYGTDDKRDLIEKNSFNFIATEEREKALEGMRAVLEKGYVKDKEYHILTKDGSKILVEMNTAIMKNVDGKPIGFVGVSRDITERKRMEEEIIRTKEHLQNIINSASEIIISFDKNYRVTSWNKTAELITGYKTRDIIGRPITKLPVFDNPQELLDTIKSICNGHKAVIDEFILKTKHGTKRIIKPSYSTIKSDNEESIGILFFGKDITHERETHGKLLKGNSYLISDKNNKAVLDLFIDLVRSEDYKGLFITRTSPEMIKGLIHSSDIQVELLNQSKLGGFDNIADLEELTAKLKDFSKKHTNAVVLLDRVDYLITSFSFEQFVKSLYQINNIIAENKSILLLHLNPSLLDSRQKTIVEEELQTLPSQKIDNIQIEDEFYDILKFVHEENQLNSLVSFKKISREFSIDKSTTAKRVRMLENNGLVSIKKQGRSKTVHISEKGNALLQKREIV